MCQYNFAGIRTNIHTYVHTYVHTYIRVHTYVHTFIRTYIHTFIHTYVHTSLHTYIRTYVHTYYIHTYIHAYIHTYVHTYVHDPLIPDRHQPPVQDSQGAISGARQFSSFPSILQRPFQICYVSSSHVCPSPDERIGNVAKAMQASH